MPPAIRVALESWSAPSVWAAPCLTCAITALPPPALQTAQSAVQEQLQSLRETSVALAAEAAELRELPAEGEERLAALLQQVADNAEAQVNAEMRLQALQQRLAPQAMRNTASLAAVRAGAAGKQDGPAAAGSNPADAQAGKQPAAPTEPAQQEQQQQPQEDAAPPAALVLRGIFSIGLEPAQVQRVRQRGWGAGLRVWLRHHACILLREGLHYCLQLATHWMTLALPSLHPTQVPFLSDGMTNGVRWGTVAGQLRLLAADQVGRRGSSALCLGIVATTAARDLLCKTKCLGCCCPLQTEHCCPALH